MTKTVAYGPTMGRFGCDGRYRIPTRELPDHAFCANCESASDIGPKTVDCHNSHSDRFTPEVDHFCAEWRARENYGPEMNEGDVTPAVRPGRHDPNAPPTPLHSLADPRTWHCAPGGAFAWAPEYDMWRMGLDCRAVILPAPAHGYGPDAMLVTSLTPGRLTPNWVKTLEANNAMPHRPRMSPRARFWRRAKTAACVAGFFAAAVGLCAFILAAGTGDPAPFTAAWWFLGAAVGFELAGFLCLKLERSR